VPGAPGHAGPGGPHGAVPDPGADGDRDTAAALEVLAGYDGVRLFLDRAQLADPSFALDGDNASAVAEICRRLDGLPLAIELAAARVRALPAAELAARLEDRFGLLTGVRRAQDPRQRTLRATIDWSFQLLEEPDRRLFRRLSVFAGGWTVAAAEAVCGGDGLDAPEAVTADAGEVLEGLVRLVDRSLVVAVGGDPARFRMLETLRAYGAERLGEAGEAELAAARHTAWFVDLAEEAAAHRTSRNGLRRLAADHDNLRAALRWAVAAGDGDLALRLAAPLGWFWWLRGDRHEAAEWLPAALAAGPAVQSTAKARVLFISAFFRAGDGDVEGMAAGRALAEEARGVAERAGDKLTMAWADVAEALLVASLGDVALAAEVLDRADGAVEATADPWTLAAVRIARAQLAMLAGDLVACRRHAEASVAGFRALRERWGTAAALDMLATTAEIEGDYSRAMTLVEEATTLSDELGLPEGAAALRCKLGNLLSLQGEHGRAQAVLEGALAETEQLGWRAGMAYIRGFLGLAARRRGDLDEARAQLEQGLAWCRELDAWLVAAPMLAWLGFVCELQGDLVAAESLHREGLELAVRSGDPRSIAFALEGLAGVACAGGDAERAALLLGAAGAMRGSTMVPLPPADRVDIDRIEAAAGRRLGEARLAEELRRGAALAAEQAVALARSG
jgi:tetratricopeptide (TPR) repeat protein